MIKASLDNHDTQVEVYETLLDTLASLDSAVALLKRTPKADMAAPSSKMFRIMLADYDKSIYKARNLLRRLHP